MEYSSDKWLVPWSLMVKVGGLNPARSAQVTHPAVEMDTWILELCKEKRPGVVQTTSASNVLTDQGVYRH